MRTRSYFILVLIATLCTTTYAQQEKTAKLFVFNLETYDYWRQASCIGNDAKPPKLLTYLQSKNPTLNKLTEYVRIHMDYGYSGRERDPMHRFTILELKYKNKKDIPFADNQNIQIYPICASLLYFEKLHKHMKTQVFPLWNYKELVHHKIYWDHREYIEWYGIRYKNSVFLIYTIPTMWMKDIPKYASILNEYLLANTEEKMQLFIQSLIESKSKYLLYTSIKDAQKMLGDLGFYQGSIDGIYGTKTEKALIELLVKLGYLNFDNANFDQVQHALKSFQKNNKLVQSGYYDKETINMLKKNYLNL